MRNKLLLSLLCVLIMLCACGRAKEPASSAESEVSSAISKEESSSAPESSEESSVEESSVEESSEETSVEESSEEESYEEEAPEEAPVEESSEEKPEEDIPDDTGSSDKVSFDTRDTWGGMRYLNTMADLAAFIAPEESSMVYELILEDASSIYDIGLLPDEALSCPYPLEGYMMADAYQLDYTGLSYTHQIVKHTIETVQAEIDAAGSDMGIHEVLTRASIVQIEAMRGGESAVAYPEVMPHIASVIDNRLSSGTPLEMDVTTRYAQFLLQTTELTEDQANAYDTYEASSLPPGPICMPSIEAIRAVLNPEISDDLFFVYDADGNYYFAANYDDHLANCEKAGIY